MKSAYVSVNEMAGVWKSAGRKRKSSARGSVYSLTKRPKLSIREILRMLRAMDGSPRTRTDLLKISRISRATFWRLLGDAERELGVIVRYDERDETYRITSWGIINRRKMRTRLA